jgi:hypothetical protein
MFKTDANIKLGTIVIEEKESNRSIGVRVALFIQNAYPFLFTLE